MSLTEDIYICESEGVGETEEKQDESIARFVFHFNKARVRKMLAVIEEVDRILDGANDEHMDEKLDELYPEGVREEAEDMPFPTDGRAGSA